MMGKIFILIIVALQLLVSDCCARNTQFQTKIDHIEDSATTCKQEDKSVKCSLFDVIFSSLKEFDDFDIEDRKDYYIYSKRLAYLLDCQDSVFIDNDGASIYSELIGDTNVSIRYSDISPVDNGLLKFLLIERSVSVGNSQPQSSLKGFIRINEGNTYSAQCRLSDSHHYISAICVGQYPIIESTDAILFEIKEIYGVTVNGELTKLPLDTKIDYCVEPFEPEFAGDNIPTYFFYTKDQSRKSQKWQQ